MTIERIIKVVGESVKNQAEVGPTRQSTQAAVAADAAHQRDLALEEAQRELEWQNMTGGHLAGGNPFPD